ETAHVHHAGWRRGCLAENRIAACDGPKFEQIGNIAAKDCALARLALARRQRRSRGGLHKITSGKSLPSVGQQSRACVTTVSKPAKVALHNSNRLPRIAKATAWLTCLAPSFFWAFLR